MLMPRWVGSWIPWCVAMAVGLVLAARPAAAGDEAAASKGAAMRMYRDPETGAIGARPPGVVSDQAATQSERAVASPAEGLTREAVAAPAGGVKINLQGRFRSAVTRHVGTTHPGADECVGPGAAAHE